MIHEPLCITIGNVKAHRESIKQLNLCEESILDIYMQHTKEGVTRDKIKSLMEAETWFNGDKLSQYFDVEIEERAAVAACASGFFDKYENIPEELKEVTTQDIVNAVIAELDNREKKRIEAEKAAILDDLDLYGI